MNSPRPTLSSEAHVATSDAPRYLRMLCKHFRHKSPTVYDEHTGRIEFPAGVCELDSATAGTLKLRVVAGDPADLGHLEGVIARHLQRFAPKEPLDVQWIRPPETATGTT
jgi:hypothetical protein